MQELYNQLKDQGFAVIAINPHDEVKRIRQFIAKENITIQVALNGVREHNVCKLYGINSFPTDILISSEGKVILLVTGFTDESHNKLKEALRELGFKFPK